MAGKLISGVEISAAMKEELRGKVEELAARGVVPGLGVVLVGDDPASRSYVTAKERDCEEVGIFSADHRLPVETTEAELLQLISEMNADDKLDGILVQLPLPKHIDEEKIIMAIDPCKDVDGFHPVSVGKMMLGQKTFLPCTPHGVIKMLEAADVKVSGSKVVIVGRSNIVGKPLANLLIQRGPYANATVTVCHTGTRDLKGEILQADIVIAAAGVPKMITGDMVREGAVVIDVGINRIPDATKKSSFRLCGDVDFDSVVEKASFITPVPGGVGPMTRAMLLSNIVESATARLNCLKK